MEKNEIGVFIVVADYIKLVSTEEGSATSIRDKHIAAVYSDYDKADKFGKWLLEQGEVNGMKYTNYIIENFIIL